MNKKYPKVLIIGHNFHYNNGAGVTLSNLFKEWPDDKLAVASFEMPNFTNLSKKITQYYRIGNKEINTFFPIKLVYNPPESQVFQNTEHKTAQNNTSLLFHSTGIKNNLMKIIFRLSGYHCHKFNLHVSNDFKKWINEINPDIIYSALGNLDLVKFLLQIKQETKRKIAIHIWDDWANSIYKNTLLSPWLKIQFNKYVPALFNIADICLSISHDMSSVYQVRYGKVFHTFHNPADIQNRKNFDKFKTKNKTICYIGKINEDNDVGLIAISQAVEKINLSGIPMQFHIYTPNQDHKIVKKILKNHNTKVFEAIKHELVLKVLSESKLLILPLNFSKKSINYTKLSMPTKATEFMASGTPVIIYAPPSIALAKHVRKHQWGYLIDTCGEVAVFRGMHELLKSEELQETLVHNAYEIVEKNYNSVIVRDQFRSILLDLP